MSYKEMVSLRHCFGRRRQSRMFVGAFHMRATRAKMPKRWTWVLDRSRARERKVYWENVTSA